MDVRCFTVGPVQENTCLVRRDGADRALMIDPGDEADRLLGAIDELGVGLDAILLTHTHFDHVGAVAPVARATGAPVYCPKIEVARAGRHHGLRARGRASGRSRATTPTRPSRAASACRWPGFDIDVIFTPGHSPGHVTYAFDVGGQAAALLLAATCSSRARSAAPTCPGGDTATLMALDRRAPGPLRRRHARLPGPHGRDDARPRARDQPVPAVARRTVSAPSSRRRAAPTTCCPSRRPSAPSWRPTARRMLEAAGYRRDRDAGLRGHGALRARRGRVDGHRPEGDVHLRRRRRALHHAAPRGDRAGLPRLPRARDAQAPAAGEALVPVELLPLRARAGRPLPPVLAGRRGGDRVRRPRRRRRGDRPAARRCCSELRVRGTRLRLSSLGTPVTRAAYRERLQAHLRAHAGELSEDVRSRIDLNPLRAFDSDHPGTRRVTAAAPRLLDELAGDDAEHFAAVRALLDAADVPYEIDPTLVRGLDYYTRTVFEFTSDALGAQSGVGGGGRYDGLVEELGGPPTPGRRLGRRDRAHAARRRAAARRLSRSSTSMSPTTTRRCATRPSRPWSRRGGRAWAPSSSSPAAR